MSRVLIICLMFTFLTENVSAQIGRRKNVAYIDKSASYYNDKRHRLDVFFPKDTTNKKGVFVFFHGGSWRSGKKNTYRLLARKMARKGFVAVLANYRLSPEVKFDEMGNDCARALHWVDENIERYGGNRDKITVAGHSAGGHLAAYVTLSDTFDKLRFRNPVDKTILIDAFGLDMYSYFKERPNETSGNLRNVFTDNPATWKVASPLYSIQPGLKIPFLIFTGSKTYPAIIKSSEKFNATLKENGACSKYKVIPGKKHIGMIVQLISGRNKMYDDMIEFMKAND